jgi:MFS family permease
LAFYNLSILLNAFIAERGFSVSLTSSATALFFVAGGIGGVIAGRLVDRFDARLVITVSAMVCAFALSLVGHIRATWELYAFHLLFGLAFGGSGLVPVTTVVARWFQVRRALAFSIASTGLSMGGILVAPLSAFAIERYGLAGAAPWLAIAFIIGVIPVTLLVLRPRPEVMGLVPDGDLPSASRGAEPVPATAYRDALRRRDFYGISIAYLFLLGAQVGAIAHLYRLANVRVGVETAALALGTLAGASTVGRLAGGWILLKVPVLAFAMVLMAVQAAALTVLAFAPDRALILAGAVMFGLTMGNSLMMHPLLLAERFGTRDYGRIYSTSQFVTMAGVASCPGLVGLMYDLSGGYTMPFLAISVVTLAGLTVLAVFGGRR